jgi:hypothetical protein
MEKKKWEGILTEQRRSGMSVSRFCKERGVSESGFHYWRKQLLKGGESERFVRVETTSPYEEIKDDAGKLISLLHNRDREIERLQVHLLNVNRKMFVKKTGRQASSSSQEELFTFEEEEAPPAEEEQTIEVTAHKKTIKRGRQPLPDSLPTRREEYWSEAKACTQCGEELVKIGEEVTEELSYIPARFEKVGHAKIKCASPRCESEGVKTGVLPPGTLPLPARGTPRSWASYLYPHQ